MAAPANDNFSSAKVVDSGTLYTAETNIAATKETGETSPFSYPFGASVWYSFKPPVTATYTFDTCDTTPVFDTLIGVYTGSAVATAPRIAEADGGCPGESSAGDRSSVTVALNASTIYHIQVSGYSGAMGPIRFRVSSPSVPTNDLFANPKTIAPGTTYPDEYNVGATTETNELTPFPGNTFSASVWYSFTPAVSGSWTFDNCSTPVPFDTAMSLWTGSTLPTLARVGAGADGGCPGETSSGQRTLITRTLTAGTTYRLQVASVFTNGTTGPFVLKVSPPPPPLNDNFSAPKTIAADTTYASETNVSATTETGEPSPASPLAYGASVWYAFTPPTTGGYTFDTCSTSPELDTLMALYTGAAVNNLTKLGSGADGGCPGETSASPRTSITRTLTAGTVYYLQVAGYGSPAATGPLVLKVSPVSPPPSNDALNGAKSISIGQTYGSETNVNATTEPGETLPSGAAFGASVWYRFKAPLTGSYTFDDCATTPAFDTRMTLYETTSPAITAVGTDADGDCPGETSSDARTSITRTLTAGKTYVLQVVGAGAGASVKTGPFVLHVSGPPNDNFANAITLTGASPRTPFVTDGATLETGEPVHGAQAYTRSVWYSWTPPSTGPKLVTCLSHGLSVEVYTGASVSALTPVSAGRCGVPFTATVGTTYRIVVSGNSLDDTLRLDPGGLITNPVNFGNQESGTIGPPQAVTYTNTAPYPVLVYGARLSGTAADDFQPVTTDTCFRQIEPGASCSVTVRFAPSVALTRSATLAADYTYDYITFFDAGLPARAGLFGSGTAVTTDPAGAAGATGGPGAIGPAGAQGAAGAAGSAGPVGGQGPQGAAGTAGAAGAAGPTGPPGVSGPTGTQGTAGAAGAPGGAGPQGAGAAPTCKTKKPTGKDGKGIKVTCAVTGTGTARFLLHGKLVRTAKIRGGTIRAGRLAPGVYQVLLRSHGVSTHSRLRVG